VCLLGSDVYLLQTQVNLPSELTSFHCAQSPHYLWSVGTRKMSQVCGEMEWNLLLFEDSQSMDVIPGRTENFDVFCAWKVWSHMCRELDIGEGHPALCCMESKIFCFQNFIINGWWTWCLHYMFLMLMLWKENIWCRKLSGSLSFGRSVYEGNSTSKLQIQVATYVFQLSAENCHR